MRLQPDTLYKTGSWSSRQQNHSRNLDGAPAPHPPHYRHPHSILLQQPVSISTFKPTGLESHSDCSSGVECGSFVAMQGLFRARLFVPKCRALPALRRCARRVSPPCSSDLAHQRRSTIPQFSLELGFGFCGVFLQFVGLAGVELVGIVFALDWLAFLGFWVVDRDFWDFCGSILLAIFVVFPTICWFGWH